MILKVGVKVWNVRDGARYVRDTFKMTWEGYQFDCKTNSEGLVSLLVSNVLSRTYLTCILHLFHTFQNFTRSFKMKLLPFLNHLKWFYACLVSLLDPNVLSRTFQNFTRSFKKKLLPFINHLEWFYACLVLVLLTRIIIISS